MKNFRVENENFLIFYYRKQEKILLKIKESGILY